MIFDSKGMHDYEVKTQLNVVISFDVYVECVDLAQTDLYHGLLSPFLSFKHPQIRETADNFHIHRSCLVSRDS